MKEKTKRYPKGHFMGIGIALGMPLGIPMWLATDNPGLIGSGLAVGVAIGAALEKKYNGNPREMTREEERRQRIAIFGGVLILVMGVAAGLALVMLA